MDEHALPFGPAFRSSWAARLSFAAGILIGSALTGVTGRVHRGGRCRKAWKSEGRRGLLLLGAPRPHPGVLGPGNSVPVYPRRLSSDGDRSTIVVGNCAF